MSQIMYHLIQKVQPGVAGGGERKYYATITQRRNISLKELSEEIADGRTLTPTDVMAVLISLSRKIPKHLLNGNIVDLGDLGRFSINVSSEGTNTQEEFTSSNIKKAKIMYRPSTDIKKNLLNASYSKINGDES